MMGLLELEYEPALNLLNHVLWGRAEAPGHLIPATTVSCRGDMPLCSHTAVPTPEPASNTTSTGCFPAEAAQNTYVLTAGKAHPPLQQQQGSHEQCNAALLLQGASKDQLPTTGKLRISEEGSTKPKYDKYLQALARSLGDILIAGTETHASRVCAYKAPHSYTKKASQDLQSVQGEF